MASMDFRWGELLWSASSDEAAALFRHQTPVRSDAVCRRIAKHLSAIILRSCGRLLAEPFECGL